MKNIWNLFRHDVRKALSNTVGIILVLGLVLIPGLFSWFNIAASWDPFSNTKNITFAVANTDEGYKSDLIPLRINVGNEVVSTLRANDQLDWVFTSKADAIDGTKSGKYYAAVVLPKSFSQDMLTFFDSNTDSTKLAYYTNEKKNALSPKITGQGAGEVSTQINEIFTKTLSDVALNLVQSLSTYLDSDETQALVKNLDSRLTTLSQQLHSAADSTQVYTTLLDSANSLVSTATGLVQGTQTAGSDAKSSISSALSSATSVKSALDAAAGSLSGALSQSAGSYDSVKTDVDALLNSLDSGASDSAATLTTLATRVDSQISNYTTLRNNLQQLQDKLPQNSDITLKPLLSLLDDAISSQQKVRDALTSTAAKIQAAATDADGERTAINKVVGQAKSSIAALKTEYDTGIKKDLASLSNEISATADDASKIAVGIDSAVSDLASSAGSVTEKLTAAKGAITDFSATLDDAGTKLTKLHDGLSAALTSGDISELQKVIGSDPDSLATALSAPVALKRIAVFPVNSFGSSMAPLYIMIPLWVGTLLMCVSIHTEVSERTARQLGVRTAPVGRVGGLGGAGRGADAGTGADARADAGADAGATRRADGTSGLAGSLAGSSANVLKPHQAYLGRFGIFAVISLLQSTFLCLGCILFLDVQAVHPWLFMLTGWLAGLVFAFMIYTLVVSFGNAGKAVGVFLLVVQISGAGGAYPLQMLPAFFQNISPFLPGTHVINALRAAIAGIYANDYWISMGYLALFLVPTLLLGLVLRKPVVNINRKFVAAVESTRMV